jgi:HAD superfamily hydrolase (TIGR01549 family)
MTAFSPITAVGLDFGCTLVSEVARPAECLRQALSSLGVRADNADLAVLAPDPAPVRAALAAARTGRAWQDALVRWYALWAERAGVAPGTQDRAAADAVRRHQAAANWRPCRSAEDLLRWCRFRGVPVGILSTWGPGLSTVVSALGWQDLVQTVIASSTSTATKPDPAAFRMLCRDLGRPPGQVLFAGDDPVADYAGARAAGLRPVLLAPAPVAGVPDQVPSLETLLVRLPDLVASR